MATTPNLSLVKPDVGNTDWGTDVNNNWDTIDGLATIISELSLDQVWSDAGWNPEFRPHLEIVGNHRAAITCQEFPTLVAEVKVAGFRVDKRINHFI